MGFLKIGGVIGSPEPANRTNDMHEPSSTCQSCRRPPTVGLLQYRRGTDHLPRETLLQCDVCERYACADCLQVYDIVSEYDFLCHDCALAFGSPVRGQRGH